MKAERKAVKAECLWSSRNWERGWNLDVAAGERGGCRAEPGAIPLLEKAQQSPSGSLFPSPPAFDLSPKAEPGGKRFSACGFILPIYTQTGSASISPCFFFLQHQFQSSWLCPTPATDSNPAFDQSISLLFCLGTDPQILQGFGDWICECF